MACVGVAFDEDEVFDQDYLYFFAGPLEETANAACELIWRVLGLSPGDRVLDLACGHGGISGRLGARGATVTGIDRTPLFLDRARAAAAKSEQRIEYVEGDMRSLPWPERRFASVEFFDGQGEPLTASGQRMIAVASR